MLTIQKRWKQDSEYNSRKYEVYRDSLWVNIFNRDIQAGDLICLKEGEVRAFKFFRR